MKSLEEAMEKETCLGIALRHLCLDVAWTYAQIYKQQENKELKGTVDRNCREYLHDLARDERVFMRYYQVYYDLKTEGKLD